MTDDNVIEFRRVETDEEKDQASKGAASRTVYFKFEAITADGQVATAARMINEDQVQRDPFSVVREVERMFADVNRLLLTRGLFGDMEP